jgi:hypothetical protein
MSIRLAKNELWLLDAHLIDCCKHKLHVKYNDERFVNSTKLRNNLGLYHEILDRSCNHDKSLGT